MANLMDRASGRWPGQQQWLACVVSGLLAACGNGTGTGHDPEAGADEDLQNGIAAPIDRARPARTDRLQGLAVNRQNPGAVPPGGADAAVVGRFGDPFGWPMIAIHMVLTPDGRVLNFGTDLKGKQGASLYYSVWDPAVGQGPDAFLILPNTTSTNVFCAGQVLMPGSGDVLVTGGTMATDLLKGIAEANVFSATGNSIAATSAMAYRRWYGTSLATPEGEVVVLGGRSNPPVDGVPGEFVTTPEVYNPVSRTWRSLPAATSDLAYGTPAAGWYYPRAWVAPNGQVFVVAPAGGMFALSTAGNGSIVKLPGTAGRTNVLLSTLMVRPGKLMRVLETREVKLIDIQGAKPVVTATGAIKRYREYGNMTLLADGKVWANGGGALGNTLNEAHYISETWDPATGQWSDAATAVKPRLYHSNAILLPDATVLTNGGGAPGPVVNLNAEIYYPPYLYSKDGSGQPAPRPQITAAPTSLGWNQAFSVSVTGDKPIARVTLVRTGAATHNFNGAQSFHELAFTTAGDQLLLQTPASRFELTAGFYLLFVIDSDGVPSVARIVSVNG